MSRVIVIGGTRGIGAAAASRLAADGYDVILTGRDRDAGEAVVAGIAAAGGRAELALVDVRDAGAMRRFADGLAPVSGIFHNAGMLRGVAPIESTSAEDFAATIDTNIAAPFAALAMLLPLVADGGSVVLTGAGAAIRPRAGLAGYAAAKAGLHVLGRAAALEVAARGVRVNIIAPGFIATESWTAMMGAHAGALAKTVPLGRIGQPEEVAELVAWLIGPRSRYISGAIIPVDGGLAAM